MAGTISGRRSRGGGEEAHTRTDGRRLSRKGRGGARGEGEGGGADRAVPRRRAAVSTRSATGARARLGRPGRGRQVLLEHLARGPVAEAAARRVVEPVGEPPQGRRRERPGLGLARQETPDAAVRVRDGAFLPGAVRVAEVA